MTSRANRQAAAPPDDGVLFSDLSSGDVTALGVLYDRHYLAVLRFVERIAKAGADAEDAAQETFLTAVRRAHTFDGRSDARSWLFGIAARTVMAQSRAGSRVSRFLGRLTGEPRRAITTPHDVAERRELSGALVAALDSLSPAKRVTIVMAESEGFTCEEIAATLNVPIGTVWTRLHHARRELRARLEKGMP